MPIYEYECSKCGKSFEQLVASHKAKGTCPHCGTSTAKRLLSAFAAHGASSAAPCDSGACPGGDAPGGGCAGGGCPFS